MTHPIIPPSELVQQWMAEPEYATTGRTMLHTMSKPRLTQMLTSAAQWGADQELEACCAIALTDPVCGTKHQRSMLVHHMRKQRRPEPPSLKEQAVDAHNRMMAGTETQDDWRIVRRALEALPE